MRALFALLLPVALLLSHSPSRADAPSVTRLRVKKGAHTLELLDGAAVVRSYKVALGPGGAGPKVREGDRVTPVGRYWVSGAIPSQFHLFMHVSYPNDGDKKRFEALKASGKLPARATIGGDIGIHGGGGGVHGDWTAGCIAVENAEIEEIARLVKPGTALDVED